MLTRFGQQEGFEAARRTVVCRCCTDEETKPTDAGIRVTLKQKPVLPLCSEDLREHTAALCGVLLHRKKLTDKDKTVYRFLPYYSKTAMSKTKSLS